jgi:hypothetical protein
MKKAIWFSRHRPTPEQIEDAARMGYALITTPEGVALGAMDLQDKGDVFACATALLGHCQEQGATAIFGVFAAPILAQIARTSEDIRQRGEINERDIPCFAAWNVQRSQEGGKPSFHHKQWLGIGRLNQNSCRWLQ